MAIFKPVKLLQLAGSYNNSNNNNINNNNNNNNNKINNNYNNNNNNKLNSIPHYDNYSDDKIIIDYKLPTR